MEEVSASEGEQVPANVCGRIKDGFARSTGNGLLRLAGDEAASGLPPSLSFFREVARLYLTSVCRLPEDTFGALPEIPAPREELERLATTAPPMRGAEYLNVDAISTLWKEMEKAFHNEAKGFEGGIKSYIADRFPRWHMVGRVCFHLAENRANEEAPFAFLATCARSVSAPTRGRSASKPWAL